MGISRYPLPPPAPARPSDSTTRVCVPDAKPRITLVTMDDGSGRRRRKSRRLVGWGGGHRDLRGTK